MDAEYSSSSDGECRLQDNKNLDESDSELEYDSEATTLCEEDDLKTTNTRICPYGYEIVEESVAASGAETNEALLDEALSDLARQLEKHNEGEAIDWKKYAAKQGEILTGIFNWALNLIDAAEPLQERLRDVLARFATAQNLVLALQREREEDAMVRASLEMQLHNIGALLKTVEDRTTTLEKENQETAAAFVTVKRQIEYLDRFVDEQLARRYQIKTLLE